MLQKLYELGTAWGSKEFSTHYLLIPNYKKCCSGKIDFIKIANSYRDTALSKHPISTIIFVKEKDGFYNDDVMPNESRFEDIGLARISYNLSLSNEDLRNEDTEQISVYVY